MIPKIIHYCWFGGKPLPDLALKCLDSWKKYLPDYEIIEWNESNYPIEEKCRYVQEAYKEKKWAFVSDYARFDLLYQYGGLYFDTDVEIIRSLDDIIEKGPFFASEREHLYSGKYDKKLVNPGLGLGAEKGMEIYREILEAYQGKSFYKANGEIDLTTVIKTVSDILSQYPKQKMSDDLIQIQEVIIYPLEYFCPLDYDTGVLTITEHTRSIHHYSATWKTVKEEKWHNVQQKVIKAFGKEKGKWILHCIPFRIIGTLYMYGLFGTVKRQMKKRKHIR